MDYRRQTLGWLLVLLFGWPAAGRGEPAYDQYRVASGHYRVKRWALAATEFEAFRRDFPGNHRIARATFYLSECHVQLGHYGPAIQLLERLAESELPAELAAMRAFRLGECQFHEGNREAARLQLRQFLDQHAKHVLAAFAAWYLGTDALTDGRAFEATNYFRRGLDRSPNGPRADACRIGLARALFELGEHEEFERLVDALASRADENVAAEALYVRGAAGIRASRFDIAVESLEELMQRFPGFNGAEAGELMLAQAYIQRNDNARAIEHARRLLSANDCGVARDALSVLAAGFASQNRLSEAIEQYERFLAAGVPVQVRPWAHVALAGCYLKDGQLDRAQSLFCQLAGQGASQVELESLAGPLADAHYQRRHPDKALEILQVLDHAAGRMSDHFRARALYLRAWIATDNGGREQAISVLGELIETMPASPLVPDAMFRAGELCLAATRPAEAEVYFKMLESVACSSELRCHARLHRVRIAAAAGDWSSCTGILAAITADECPATLREHLDFWLAEADYQQQHWIGAEARFSALLASALSGTDSWQLIVRLRCAQLAARGGNWRPAAELVRGVLAADEDFSHRCEAQFLLGKCLVSEARFEEARESFGLVASSVARTSELGAMAQWMVGECYFHQRKFGEAIREYLRCELLSEHDQWRAAALLQAAKCHDKLGQRNEGRALLEKIINEFPDEPVATDARIRLDHADRTARRGNRSTTASGAEIPRS